MSESKEKASRELEARVVSGNLSLEESETREAHIIRLQIMQELRRRVR